MATKRKTKTRLKVAAKKVAPLRAVSIMSIKDMVSNPVSALRQQFGFNRKIFARLTGFSERAIADWEANKPLSDISRKRVQEMSRLRLALANVMREDFIGQWLNAPNEAFQGLKPLEVIERGEIDRLWRMIYRLESGIPG